MQGRNILFLHAFPLCGSMWDEQKIFFERKGFKVFTPTYPGFCGVEDRNFRSLNDYAKFVLPYMNEKFVIVGCSMGGYIALHILELYPHLVEGLVLSNTRSTPDTPEASRRRWEIVNSLKTEMDKENFIRSMVPKLFYSKTHLDKALNMALKSSINGIKSALISMANRTDKTHLLSTNIPKLIIGSDKDEFVHLNEINYMYENSVNAKLHVFHNVGHIPAMEVPDEFNELLYEWLESTFH